ncbi:3'-5' exonuclease [Neorhizobium galegae]|uniref:3'-5' exonuclease n=1 Tax=Neorhizobium galegae TaxID=399 RepID=UPI0006210316|nr:3'-5' exonuclease [Neorhizobium galegae]CDZ55049.1 Endodeoxyribonuclease [Neorhizobium galegae bv. orientalis]
MDNTMLDIETWGTSPGCAIRSIGAVTFDLSGKIGETFYVNVDKQSCLQAGLVVNPETEKWWAEQSAAAQKALLDDPKSLTEACRRFRSWFHSQSAPIIWSQGANFDPPLLEAAYKACSVDVPWRFYNVRDTRTVYDLFAFDTRDLARRRVHHNALDDTLHQVELVAAALRKGRAPEKAPATYEGVFE